MTAEKAPRRRATKATPSSRAAKATGTTIELKIGVENSPREVVIEVELTADEILEAVAQATATNTSFTVQDPKGRYVVVPGNKICYLEIGEPATRKVGFGVL